MVGGGRAEMEVLRLRLAQHVRQTVLSTLFQAFDDVEIGEQAGVSGNIGTAVGA